MSLKKLKISLLVLAGALVVAALLLWFNLSQLTRKFANEQIPGLTVGKVELSWNRVKLTDFSYSSGGSVAVGVTARSVEAHPTFLSFLTEEIEVAKLDIAAGSFRLVRKEKSPPQPSNGGQPAGKPGARADFKEIRLLDGKGEIVDETVPGSPRVTLQDLELQLKDLKYPIFGGATSIDGYCVVKGQPDGQAQLTGWIDAVNQSAELHLNLASVDLKNLRPYFENRVRTIEGADGTADLELAVSMVNGTYNATGAVTLADLHLGQAPEESLKLPMLLLVQYLKFNGNRVKIPFKITGDLKNREHRVNFAALLSDVLNQELSLEALQKKTGLERSFKDLDKDLRRLKDKAKELRKLF